MTKDMEELAREGMRQLTETMRVSPDLAARTYRQHQRRRRRTLTGLAGAAVLVAAGVTAAVTTLGTAGHQPAAQLTAWTVVKQANGDIEVTIDQLKDPAGLQSTLNADGVPASVSFSGQFNPACARSGSPQSNEAVIKNIITGQLQRGSATGSAFTVNPSAIPSGLGLQIGVTNAPVAPGYAIGFALVQASQQCTGVS